MQLNMSPLRVFSICFEMLTWLLKKHGYLTVLQGKQLVNLTGLALQNKLALLEKFEILNKHNTDAVIHWMTLLIGTSKAGC